MPRLYVSKWKKGKTAQYKFRKFSAIAPRGYDGEKWKVSRKHGGVIFPKKK